MEPNDLQFWLNLNRRSILWEADGKEASVAVSLKDSLAFLVNGKSDGNAISDMPTQVMLGVTGGILHPRPETCLVVGLGTGESAGWAAAFPSITRVDVVEIEPVVTEMARLCAPVNNNVLQHPKVHLIYNDAREVLLTTPHRYDLILSEPSNLYRAGVPNLYTREFYEAVRSRLKPGGIFVQWLQTYEADRTAVRTIFSTLRSVFPHQEAWEAIPDDMLLVCRNEPPQYDASTLRERLREPDLRQVLQAALQVQDLEGWLSRYLTGPEGLASISDETPPAPVNTDDRNFVEYGYARSLGKGSFSSAELQLVARKRGWHRPNIAGGAVDWESVDSQILARLALADHKLPLDSTYSMSAQVQARAYQAYVDGRMGEFVAKWNTQDRDPRTSAELLILTASTAYEGLPKAATLIKRLRGSHPWEADAVEAYWLVRQKKADLAHTLLVKSLIELRTSPWPNHMICRALLSITEEVAYADPSKASAVYQALSQPFALYRLEEHRRRLAYNLAANLHDPVLIAQAIAFHEPHIPWNEPYLKTRADAYLKTGNPLADQAQRDLEQFRRQVVRQSGPSKPSR